jgi:hypothetical protein
MAEQLKQAAAEVRRSPRGSPMTMRHEALPETISGYEPMPVAPRGVPGQPGTCWRCGAANSPLNRYCTTCGYELSGVRGQGDRYLLPNGRPLRCRIIVRNGPLAGRAYLLHQDVTTFGRNTGNDIVIPDGTVSRHHARLFFQSGQWLIEDLGSANGTWVNGAPATRPTPLMHGAELRLGDDFMTFELVG